ncbi:MAG TPA: hypothetical protein VF550_19570 [Polyangia bacterium]
MRIAPIAALLLVLSSHRAFAAAPSTVAVAVDASDLSPKLAGEVEDGMAFAVLSGLAEVFSNLVRARVDLTPVSDATIVAQVRDCGGIECLEDLARSAGVDLVVQVNVQAKQSSKRASRKASQKVKPDHAVSMIVARDAPERYAWREKTNCQGCNASEIKHMASLLASTIAERITFDALPAKAALPSTLPKALAQPAPMPVTIVNPPLPVTIVNPPLPDPKPEWHVPRPLSIAALAGGLVLIGTGIYLRHIDGQGTCNRASGQSQCPQLHSTGALGTGMIVGGSLAALGGLTGLIFFGPSIANTQVGFTASSISLRGVF